MIKVAARLVHSEPAAWLASQNWFIAHTSSPHVHAPLLSADAFVETHALGSGTAATSTLGALHGAAYTF